MRAEALDHVLIFGPPGLGKTTLAHIIAAELGVNLRQTAGPVLERPGDLAAILTNLQPRDVLFVDEIHRLSPVVEEVLYPAMEDYSARHHDRRGARRALDQAQSAAVHAGGRDDPRRPADLAAARPLRHRAAAGVLSTCRDRAHRAALGPHPEVPIEAAGALRIAQRARGTPRIANRLLRRVRDYAQVKGRGHIDRAAVALAALDLLQVDPQGLDALDRKLLLTIMEKFDGGPVGIESLAAAIGEERGTLEDVIEPFLIQQGFLVRTARGRIATRNAYAHFGLKAPTIERDLSLPLFRDSP